MLFRIYWICVITRCAETGCVPPAKGVIVSGDAGTGKILVAINLFYYLKNNDSYKDKNIAIVVSSSEMKDTIQYVFKNINGCSMKWNNRKNSGWIRRDECKNEVGSIYTLSGIDLNYVGVIIGPELYFDLQDNRIKVNTDKFYDNVVKKNTSDKKLLEFILNTYGVLLTRAIKGTYIYVYDDALRDYLTKFID